MGDIGDFWRDVNAARQEKRASNRASSPDLLREAGISFESKNGGAHLIVKVRGHTIDFWPGTGLWIMRGSTKRHGGVRKLIAFVKEQQ
jgi:hypothetical protein